MSELPDGLYMIGDASEAYVPPETLEVISEPIPTPMKERRIGAWYIDEYDVLQAIQDAGYSYIHDGCNWYTADIPIPPDGAFTLPDGRFLWSVGTLLTLLTKEQRQQKAVEAFDARLAAMKR